MHIVLKVIQTRLGQNLNKTTVGHARGVLIKPTQTVRIILPIFYNIN